MRGCNWTKCAVPRLAQRWLAARLPTRIPQTKERASPTPTRRNITIIRTMCSVRGSGSLKSPLVPFHLSTLPKKAPHEHVKSRGAITFRENRMNGVTGFRAAAPPTKHMPAPFGVMWAMRVSSLGPWMLCKCLHCLPSLVSELHCVYNKSIFKRTYVVRCAHGAPRTARCAAPILAAPSRRPNGAIALRKAPCQTENQ